MVLVGLVLIAIGTAVGYLIPRGSGIDESIATFAIDQREAWLTRAFRVITASGSTAFLLPFAIVVAVVLVVRERTTRPAVFITVAGAGVLLLYQSIKVAVSRPRPELEPIIAVATGYAFPSGHAAQSVALLGAIATALTHRAPRRWQIAAAVTVIVWAALIGASRVYLGVHWTSDVIGGWTLGAVWLLVVTRCLCSGASSRSGVPVEARTRAPC